MIGRIENSVDKWKGRSRCRKQRDWWHRHRNVHGRYKNGSGSEETPLQLWGLVGPGSCRSSGLCSYDWSSLGAFKCALTFCGLQPAASPLNLTCLKKKKKSQLPPSMVLIFTWIFSTSLCQCCSLVGCVHLCWFLACYILFFNVFQTLRCLESHYCPRYMPLTCQKGKWFVSYPLDKSNNFSVPKRLQFSHQVPNV